MRILLLILQKEFKQLFRSKTMLVLIFVVPIIQLLILPLAANFDVRNIRLSVIDFDNSTYSQKLIEKIFSSGFFKCTGVDYFYKRAFRRIENDQVDLILEIPHGFESNFRRESSQEIFLAVDAINGTKANLGATYLNSITSAFNEEILQDLMPADRYPTVPDFRLVSNNWFNPTLDYKFLMVPGILVVLVTVSAISCSFNIVKEKEDGTIEQLNVTPIKKHLFILGKMIPFWIIGIIVFSIGFFLVAGWVYKIHPLGSIALLYVFLMIFLIALLGFGLLIATYSENHKQSMSIGFFFIMIFILMSGLFTPIDNMPEWAKAIAACNPVTYFIEVIRMIVLKGSAMNDIKTHFVIIAGFAILFNSWAIINYKKTS